MQVAIVPDLQESRKHSLQFQIFFISLQFQFFLLYVKKKNFSIKIYEQNGPNLLCTNSHCPFPDPSIDT